MNKYLIINADDFGICSETNKAIKELFLNKKITSTSLLANAEAAQEAIAIAKELNISVGVHLTLNSDFEKAPWKAMIEKSSLSIDGFLPYDTQKIAQGALSADVTRECQEQIEYILKSGVDLDHLDNHSGTMYGINKRLFFINAFKLSKKYKLPFRFPKQNDFLKDFFNNEIPSVIKLAHKIIVFIAKMMKVTLVDNMISNPYSISEINGYKSLEDYYLNAIYNLKEGVAELFLHPSYHSPTLSQYTKEWKKREYELELLFSQKFEDAIKNHGVKLISYKDIKK